MLAAISACANAADAPAWIASDLPSRAGDALPLLLQADGDAAPEWGIQVEREVTIVDPGGTSAPHTIVLPANTTLFDLRDTDRNGTVEVAAIRAGHLEYWADANTAHESDPVFSVTNEAIASLSTGGPRPFPLFLEERGEDFVTVPVGSDSLAWMLDGSPLERSAEAPEGELSRTQFHAWLRENGLHIAQRFARGNGGPPSSADANPPAGNRRARDASSATPDEWPWFPLQKDGDARVSYALAPPEFRDTLIRIDRRDANQSAAPAPRRFPGILIAPHEDGTDFNGDGFNDLLFWRAPSPGQSLDALVQAAQDGSWEVNLTVHLFDRATGRFAARPIEWVRTGAPLEGVLTGGVRGPFSYLRIADIDGNGRAELVCSGADREMSVWRFSGGRDSTPWATIALRDPILDVALTAQLPGYHWLGVLRTTRGYQFLALPKR